MQLRRGGAVEEGPVSDTDRSHPMAQKGCAWLYLQHSHVPSLPESAVFATRSLILFEIKTPKSTFICLQYER